MLERCHLSEEKAISLVRHIRDGCGTRSTSRLIEVDKNTVTRYSRLAGKHGLNPTMSSWPFPPQTKEVQFDEKWSFVGKKEEPSDSHDPPGFGQNWDHTAIDAESRLLLSLVPGKRTAKELPKTHRRC